jgi:hypothetical protein
MEVYKELADEEFDKFHDERLAELPNKFVNNCVTFLKLEIPEYAKDNIKIEYKKDPIYWCVPYHLNWGMGIRNSLRQAGFTDDLFPTNNLDDYYVRLIEIACGLREYGE